MLPDVPGCLCLCTFLSSHVARMCPDACVYAHFYAAMWPGFARMLAFMCFYKQPCCPDVPGCLGLCASISSHVARMCPDARVYAHLQAAMLPGCARMPVIMGIYTQACCPDVPGCLCLCTFPRSHAARMCPDACAYGHFYAAMWPGFARMLVFMPISKQPRCPDVSGCVGLGTFTSSHAVRMCSDACVYAHFLTATRPGCARMHVFMHIYKQPYGPDVPGCLCLCTPSTPDAPGCLRLRTPSIPDATKPSADVPGCLPGIPELKVLKRHMCPGCLANGGESTTNAIVRGEGGGQPWILH